MAIPEYKGIALPTATKKWPHFKTEAQLVVDSVRTILMTRIGERFFVPDFGTGLHRLLFDPNDHITSTMATQIIRTALRRWEPRVTVLKVLTRSTEHLLDILVQYRINRLGLDVLLVLQLSKDLPPSRITVISEKVRPAELGVLNAG